MQRQQEQQQQQQQQAMNNMYGMPMNPMMGFGGMNMGGFNPMGMPNMNMGNMNMGMPMMNGMNPMMNMPGFNGMNGGFDMGGMFNGNFNMGAGMNGMNGMSGMNGMGMNGMNGMGMNGMNGMPAGAMNNFNNQQRHNFTQPSNDEEAILLVCERETETETETETERKGIAQDNSEEYDDDTTIIPRSTTVVARRLPATKPGAGRGARYVSGKMPASAKNSARKEQVVKSATAKVASNAFSQMNSAMTEEEKMAAMFAAQSEQWSAQQEEMSHQTPVFVKGGAKRPANFAKIEVFRKLDDHDASFVSVASDNESASELIRRSPLEYQLATGDSKGSVRTFLTTNPSTEPILNSAADSQIDTESNIRVEGQATQKDFKLHIFPAPDYIHSAAIRASPLHGPWADGRRETIMSSLLKRSLPADVAADGLSDWESGGQDPDLDKSRLVEDLLFGGKDEEDGLAGFG
ncbi:hypothetical protein BN1723_009405 [Verticillium longisporum]|uniref:DWNN domain-containing protein n=1 Tax=Verticillium longisporum TaxID=100787 RepID=A0A0G4KP59_VERLO|nr:hypothetical protein BN1723_009405 [Verticillium longisporum]